MGKVFGCLRLMAVITASLAFVPSATADWPQWRGPKRDGYAAGFSAPANWPDKLTRKWSVEVGEGHSSPIVAGDSVYQFSRHGEAEIVRRLRLSDGKEVWKQSYPAPYEMSPPARNHGKGPKSTPIVHEGKVYAFGISGILSCFDATAGKLVWRRDFKAEFPKTSPEFGVAVSPLVHKGRLIVHAGGEGKGALLALDSASGKTIWSWTEDGPAYASPLVATFGSSEQIVTQSEKQVVGLDFATGKTLWTAPFTTPYDQNSVTPVIDGNVVIFSGHQERTFALRVFATKGGGWTAEEVWTSTDVPMYMSTPVIAKGVLYGFTEKQRGSLFALDPKSGKTLWGGAPRQGENAALIVLGDKLLVLTTDGRLNVANFGHEGVETVAEYKVAESPTWAHPAVVEGGILIKDFGSLALWSW